MDIENFINHVASGENIEAKDTLEGILSAKAFDALQSHKQELAKAIFDGTETSDENESEEVTEEE